MQVPTYCRLVTPNLCACFDVSHEDAANTFSQTEYAIEDET